MRFNNHYNLEGKHAFLSASKYSWLNYDEEALERAYNRHQAKVRGTRLHDLAANAIELGVKMPRSKNSFNEYVNDAIGFKMDVEKVLAYSDYCFGTVDAISFRKSKLRIHDLKTGVTATKFDQLEIYAALFCLEYDIPPNDIYIELRIYQLDEVRKLIPDPEDIMLVMEKIKEFSKLITTIRNGE